MAIGSPVRVIEFRPLQAKPFPLIESPRSRIGFLRYQDDPVRQFAFCVFEECQTNAFSLERRLQEQLIDPPLGQHQGQHAD